MLLSEEEAKTRWCPFARAALRWVESSMSTTFGSGDAVAATVNRGTGLSAECNCISSACMAWRWARLEPHGHGNGKGYCGLAGNPSARAAQAEERAA